jgi:hypothetical protein
MLSSLIGNLVMYIECSKKVSLVPVYCRISSKNLLNFRKWYTFWISGSGAGTVTLFGLAMCQKFSC